MFCLVETKKRTEKKKKERKKEKRQDDKDATVRVVIAIHRNMPAPPFFLPTVLRLRTCTYIYIYMYKFPVETGRVLELEREPRLSRAE